MRDLLATPFGWALGALYNMSGNYLLALLIITVVLRLILLPSSVKQQKSSAKQMRLQAKVNKIRQKYAGQGRDAQMKISQETQELYKREGYNPTASGCLPLFLQLFVMMGLYGAIYSPLSKVLQLSTEVMDSLKLSFCQLNGVAQLSDLDSKTVGNIELNILNRFSDMEKFIDPNVVSGDIFEKITTFVEKFSIFGIDLTAFPNQWKELGMTILLLVPVFAGLSGLLTSVYTFIKQKKTNPEMASNPMLGCMSFSSPLICVIFAYTLPAGIGFYWIITNILSFIQIIALAIFIKPADVIADQMIDETVKRRSREQSIKTTKALLAAREKQNNE